MAEINVYYDPMGNTLTVWFGDQKLKALPHLVGNLYRLILWNLYKTRDLAFIVNSNYK